MSTLRSAIEQVVVDHFDPSVMGRTQAVDDIMAAISEHNAATTQVANSIAAQIHNAAVPQRARSW